MARQIIFRDNFENSVHAGILLNDGTALCGCCGGILEPEDFRILHIYDYWVELEPQIAGNDSLEIFTNDNLTDEEIVNYFNQMERN